MKRLNDKELNSLIIDSISSLNRGSEFSVTISTAQSNVAIIELLQRLLDKQEQK